MSDQDSMTSAEFNEYQKTGVLPLRLARKKVLGDPPVVETKYTEPMISVGKDRQEPKAVRELYDFLQYGKYGTVKREYEFHPRRKWRADFFLPEQNPPVMVEYDGILHHGANQGHASINGILRDVEKTNAATALGIRVFRCNAKNWEDGTFASLLDKVLERIP